MSAVAIDRWHQVAKQRDYKLLRELIAEDCVFESPVVHRPQVGKAITLAYLGAALRTLNNDSFHYLNEWFGAKSAVLEFQTTLDDIVVNGVDIITWNESDQIVHFKVMVRPLKAINKLHQLMAAALEAAKS